MHWLVSSCSWVLAFAAAEADLPVETRGTFEVATDKIALEYVLSRPAAKAPCPGVVLCHPDPRLGGMMDDRVVLGLASSLQAAGYATLRFNFRGVGNSGGKFDEGDGQKRDAGAAVHFLAAQAGVLEKQLYLVGYSFGAVIGLAASLEEPRIAAFGGVGYPTDCFKGDEATEWPNAKMPLLFVGGDNDPWCRMKELEKAIKGTKLGARFHVIPNADHFFRNPATLKEAAEEVASFLGQVRKGQR